jgi:hypothetical protein
MKTFVASLAPVRVVAMPSTLCKVILLLLAGGLLISARVRAADDSSPYRINLSSMVERAYTRFSKEPYREHGKRYAIISLAPVAEYPLKRPVNEAALLAELRRALAVHGFHETESGKNPDIVLTVLYGRSHLVNPYTKDSIDVTPGGVGVPMLVIGEVEARTISKPGGAAKLIAAGAEKLFIAISAWQYPATQTEKPKLVWRTIVNTDDPDEDLNLLSEKMLLAAAQFFDHPIEEPEITFSSDLPEGWVKIGDATVVDPAKPAK